MTVTTTHTRQDLRDRFGGRLAAAASPLAS
jgi:hypothetical protein